MVYWYKSVSNGVTIGFVGPIIFPPIAALDPFAAAAAASSPIISLTGTAERAARQHGLEEIKMGEIQEGIYSLSLVNYKFTFLESKLKEAILDSNVLRFQRTGILK